MENNLFANFEEVAETSGTGSKTEYYEEVLGQRVRPVVPEQKNIEPEQNLKKMDTMLTERSATLNIAETKKQVSYSHEEILENATAYFEGDTLAAGVWMNKYALKDSEGNIYELTPDDMHRRLAEEVARIEKKYPNPMGEEEIFELFRNFKYIIPQGSPMAGMGNNYQVSSLSNCFVIGGDSNYDSYGGIMKIDQEQVQLMKRRGGVGHDLSHIRPTGSPVKNSALTSTGIVPFMERYSNSTREVAQDGRRGALMLSISVKHPDAENFIDAKMEQGKVTGANVSVKIDDEFMRAVIGGTPYRQQYPIYSDNPMKVQEIDALGIWNKIIHNAWKSAEPGVLFWDTIIKESVPDCYADLGFKTMSTNPCGEIPLCPYDSCRLIAINLYSYVENPFTPQARFNMDLFKKHSAYALRIMDDIIDLESEKIDAILAKVKADPEDEEIKRIERKMWENIRQKTLLGRRTGIGITAEGDMLAALGMRYGSEDATTFSVEVHKSLATEVYGASADLAAERGPFPIYNFEREKNNPFIQILDHEIEVMKESLVESMRTVIETVEQKVESTEYRMMVMNQDFLALPGIEREYFSIMRRFKIIDNLYDFLLKRKSEVELQRAANMPDHEIIDIAGEAGITNVSKNPRTAYMNAYIWAILLPSVFLFMLVYFNNRILAIEDITSNTDVSVIGTVASYPSQGHDIVLRSPGSYFTELFRIIRIKLDLLPEKSQQVVVITSSTLEEGKTFFAANMASVYALTGKKSLFVGFDFRSPEELEGFALNTEVGITNHLVGGFPLDQVVQKTFTKNLDILLSGPVPPNPDELIESDKTKSMFEQLRKNYDYIIIDTPPIGLFGDAYLLNKYSDATLFLVRNNFTRKREFVSSINEAVNNRLKGLWIVYNDVKLKVRDSDLKAYGGVAPKRFILYKIYLKARRLIIDFLRNI